MVGFPSISIEIHNYGLTKRTRTCTSIDNLLLKIIIQQNPWQMLPYFYQASAVLLAIRASDNLDLKIMIMASQNQSSLTGAYCCTWMWYWAFSRRLFLSIRLESLMLLFLQAHACDWSLLLRECQWPTALLSTRKLNKNILLWRGLI